MLEISSKNNVMVEFRGNSQVYREIIDTYFIKQKFWESGLFMYVMDKVSATRTGTELY